MAGLKDTGVAQRRSVDRALSNTASRAPLVGERVVRTRVPAI